MTPIEELKAEHEGILLMLRILESIGRRLEDGQKVDPGDFEAAVKFLRVFVDSCHHKKEEVVLFPNMEQSGVEDETSKVDSLLEEHAKAREMVEKISRAVEDYKEGKEGSVTEINENLESYIDLLREHIETENQVTYPIAQIRFSPQQQSQMESAFEMIEEQELGHGKHEEFHTLLDKLSSIYLS